MNRQHFIKAPCGRQHEIVLFLFQIKAGTLCTEDQSSHNVLLGRSLVQIGSLSLFEPLKAEGGEDATEAEQEAQQRIFVRYEEESSS